MIWRLALVLTVATADYDSTRLAGSASAISCLMDAVSQPLFTLREMYKRGTLVHNGTVINATSNATSDTDKLLRHIMWAQLNPIRHNVALYFAGFHDDLFLGYFSNGSVGTTTLPSMWGGGQETGTYIWTHGARTDDHCTSLNISHMCRKYYYTTPDGNPLMPYFMGKHFILTNRAWYADARDTGSMWSEIFWGEPAASCRAVLSIVQPTPSAAFAAFTRYCPR